MAERLVGDPNLDFLMGAQSSFQQSKEQQNAIRGPIPSLYIQDTYRATQPADVSRRLCVGVHNSCQLIISTAVTIFNMAAFLANQVSTVYPNAPAGAFTMAIRCSRQFTKNSPWQFSPNVGLTLDPFGKARR